MSKVVELFGISAKRNETNWQDLVASQKCPFLGKQCYKVRKSDPSTSIGSCSVLYGDSCEPVIICPSRLLERKQIFIDCLHLLTLHEPGNELHILSEISIPGGSVDFFLVSTKNSKVCDFIGIELQTLDTTGTVWPERQRLLKKLNIPRNDDLENSGKSFGMNWKMTAKTILVQMHHKAQTFEHLNKKLVLVVQDKLLEYMGREFSFGHLSQPARIGDSVHFHAYGIPEQANGEFRLDLRSRLSTDTNGVATCLGLQSEARVELAQIVAILQAKISQSTLFTPF